MVKEKDQALQRVESEHREIMGAILETKANPEQYGQALEYLRLVNSPNRHDQEQALAFMQQEIAVMARRLGKPVPGVNMLEGHNDLIEEVSTGRLSPERAQEIAAARAAAQEAQRLGQRQQQNEQVTRQNLAAVNQGKADLTALGKQLQAADPTGYEAKRKILVNTLKPVFATIPPNQWAATFKRAYDALPAPARPVPPPPPAINPGAKPPGGGGNTPLRASNPAGSAAPAPKSAAEALEMGLAAARG
jgi:transcription initiation factor TFIID subunit TAF12